MPGESLNPFPLNLPPAGDAVVTPPPETPLVRLDPRQPVAPLSTNPSTLNPSSPSSVPLDPAARPLWVTWFAHPFANWFWFYFGFVAALSGSNMGYPSLGPVVILCWFTGHLANSKHPWGEIKLLVASAVMGFIGDGLITLLGVLKFHEPTWLGWPIPLWMVMMWPNFAATLNSSMKWLRGRYQLGAVLGAIAGPFSYYGGVKWGAVEFGVGFWLAMVVIAIEWALAMPALLWLSAKWVPPSEAAK